MTNPVILIEVKDVGLGQTEAKINRLKGRTKELEKANKDANTAAKDFSKSAAAGLVKQTRVINRAREQMLSLIAAAKRQGASVGEIKKVTQAYNSLRKSLQGTQVNMRRLGEVQDTFTARMNASRRTLDRQAAAQRKVQAATKKTGLETAKSSKFADKFGLAMQNAGSSAVLAVGPLSGFGARVLAIGAIVRRGTILMAAFIGGFIAAITVLNRAVKAASKAQASFLQIEAVLKSTGKSANFTAGQLDNMAQKLALATLTNAEAARKAVGQLLTFTNIAPQFFERTLVAAQDLASLGFTNLESAARQLGKALEDPRQGLESLRRVGILFNAELKREINTLNALGETNKAQAKIMDFVEGKIGGAAAGQGKGLAGAFDSLRDSVTQAMEALGNTLALEKLARAIFTVSTFVENIFGKGISKLSSDELVAEIKSVDEQMVELARKMQGTKRLMGDNLFTNFLQMEQVKSLEALNNKLKQLKQALVDVTRASTIAADRASKGLLGVAASEEVRKNLINISLASKLMKNELIGLNQGGLVPIQPETVKLAEKLGVLETIIGLGTNKVVIMKDEIISLNAAFKKFALEKDALAVFKENLEPLEIFTQRMASLKVLIDAQVISLELYRRAVNRAVQTLVAGVPLLGIVNSAFDNVGRTIVDALNNGKSAMENFKSVFKKFVDDLLAEVFRLVFSPARNFIVNFLGPILTAAAGNISGPNTTTTSPTSTTPTGAPTGSGVTPSSPFLAAKGIAFSGGVRKLGRGGILNRPTLFGSREGLNLGGEAGTEGVLPLKRTKSGDLGVQVAGKSGGDTFVIDARGADKGQLIRLEAFIKQVNGSIETRAINATVKARQRNPQLFGGRGI